MQGTGRWVYVTRDRKGKTSSCCLASVWFIVKLCAGTAISTNRHTTATPRRITDRCILRSRAEEQTLAVAIQILQALEPLIRKRTPVWFTSEDTFVFSGSSPVLRPTRSPRTKTNQGCGGGPWALSVEYRKADA